MFLVLEQASPECVVIWKTFDSNMPNTDFNAFSGHSSHIIEGFKHCFLLLSIDGIHLYRKYKGMLLIAMGCDRNNQLFPLAFAITEDENIDS